MVGETASGPREDVMVEITVAVGDAGGADDLMRRLIGVFDRSSVSLDGARGEIRVESELDSRGVVVVLGAVEAWLAEDGIRSTRLSIGDRSYTMVGAAAAASGP
jgi:hypothetical protein